VFPRKTKATPIDALAYFGPPDRLAEADEIHVSVTFTYDKQWAEHLAEQWRHVAPVKLGGGAYCDRGDEFVPGKYIKSGYVITSRGCPRRCWFCSVWKRDPVPRLLPIIDGWNVLDDNLLACSREHVEAVFAMLRKQNRRVEFTGGLEALSLQDYQVELLAGLRPRPTMFWAYDPGDAFETLQSAASRLLAAGFPRGTHLMRCYVLVGYPNDTFASNVAERADRSPGSPAQNTSPGKNGVEPGPISQDGARVQSSTARRAGSTGRRLPSLPTRLIGSSPRHLLCRPWPPFRGLRRLQLQWHSRILLGSRRSPPPPGRQASTSWAWAVRRVAG
jgi:hypothetical protein